MDLVKYLDFEQSNSFRDLYCAFSDYINLYIDVNSSNPYHYLLGTKINRIKSKKSLIKLRRCL